MGEVRTDGADSLSARYEQAEERTRGHFFKRTKWGLWVGLAFFGVPIFFALADVLLQFGSAPRPGVRMETVGLWAVIFVGAAYWLSKRAYQRAWSRAYDEAHSIEAAASDDHTA